MRRAPFSDSSVNKLVKDGHDSPIQTSTHLTYFIYTCRKFAVRRCRLRFRENRPIRNSSELPEIAINPGIPLENYSRPSAREESGLGRAYETLES